VNKTVVGTLILRAPHLDVLLKIDIHHKYDILSKKINNKENPMPEISRFLGIIIFMNFNEHAPPHFHAKYGEYQISVNIKEGIMEGKFPPRALKLVLEWHSQHKDELLDNWNTIMATGEYHKIQPLE
jgi:Domain of unknown function (DUF4160)